MATLKLLVTPAPGGKATSTSAISCQVSCQSTHTIFAHLGSCLAPHLHKAQLADPSDGLEASLQLLQRFFPHPDRLFVICVPTCLMDRTRSTELPIIRRSPHPGSSLLPPTLSLVYHSNSSVSCTRCKLCLRIIKPAKNTYISPAQVTFLFQARKPNVAAAIY